MKEHEYNLLVRIFAFLLLSHIARLFKKFKKRIFKKNSCYLDKNQNKIVFMVYRVEHRQKVHKYYKKNQNKFLKVGQQIR